MSDPSFNTTNLVTVEGIYSNVRYCMDPSCVIAYNAVRSEIFSLLTDVSYNCVSPVNSIFYITNVITDASGGLIDSPYITCVYSWTPEAVPSVKAQKILQVLCSNFKKLKLKAFFNSNLTDCRQTLTVYYPTDMDKNFITSV